MNDRERTIRAELYPLPSASQQPADDAAPEVRAAELWQGRYSILASHASWTFCAVYSLLVVMSAWSFLPHDATVFGFAALLLAALWASQLCLWLKRYLSSRFVLTADEVRHERGYFRRDVRRLSLADIERIECVQTRFDRWLNVGTLRLIPRDGCKGEMLLEGIRNVDAVRRQIESQRAECNQPAPRGQAA